ncbi:MAG: hypothetical protein U9P70_01920 [Patescibacteria group bacterium]|nr:hypothetical protein [Patescibacteria group bacterium]
MTKFFLAKIVAFVVMLVLLAGFVFFKKDEKAQELSESEIKRQQLIEDVKRQKEHDERDMELTIEKKIINFAENFTTMYYSYTWGSFSNIESQYYYMTNEMKNREEDKVEKMRKEIENQPQRYFSTRAKLIDSTHISYNEEKASLEINLSINKFAGAIVERDTLVWVDENGNYYEEDETNLITDTINKSIEIDLVKIDDEWKVDQIREK